MEGRSLGLAPVGVVVGPRPGLLQSKIFFGGWSSTRLSRWPALVRAVVGSGEVPVGARYRKLMWLVGLLWSAPPLLR